MTTLCAQSSCWVPRSRPLYAKPSVPNEGFASCLDDQGCWSSQPPFERCLRHASGSELARLSTRRCDVARFRNLTYGLSILAIAACSDVQQPVTPDIGAGLAFAAGSRS